jgi:DNA-binding PadR family transcriptional regulator
VPRPINEKMLHVLLALAGGELHGYAVKQDVEERTGGSVKMGPGTLYETLQRAESSGLIEELEERPPPESDHSQRRYYRLTGAGRSALEAEVRRLGAVVDDARSRLRAAPGKGNA